jgi:hypothetical protein
MVLWLAERFVGVVPDNKRLLAENVCFRVLNAISTGLREFLVLHYS